MSYRIYEANEERKGGEIGLLSPPPPLSVPIVILTTNTVQAVQQTQVDYYIPTRPNWSTSLSLTNDGSKPHQTKPLILGWLQPEGKKAKSTTPGNLKLHTLRLNRSHKISLKVTSTIILLSIYFWTLTKFFVNCLIEIINCVIPCPFN